MVSLTGGRAVTARLSSRLLVIRTWWRLGSGAVRVFKSGCASGVDGEMSVSGGAVAVDQRARRAALPAFRQWA